jgi:hypothetical protein
MNFQGSNPHLIYLRSYDICVDMEIGDIFFKSSYVRSLYRKVVPFAPKWPNYYSGKLFGRWKKAGSEIRPPNNKLIHIGIRQELLMIFMVSKM